MTPKQILKESEPRETRCQRLHEAFPDCICEINSFAPDLSPGPVDDRERLGRIIHSPAFWDEDLKIVKTAAFAEAGTCGMSVTRLDHCSPEDLHKQTEQIEQAKPGRKFIKVISTLCGDIRNLHFEGQRAFCVYDTAISTNAAHADVYQAHPDVPKSKRSDMRRQLQKLFRELDEPASGAVQPP